MEQSDLVMLAEDDENDAILIQRAFLKLQIKNPFYRVKNGDDAIAYLEGTGVYEDRKRFPPPFLLLLDLKLPNRSGFEVLDWIRRHPNFKRLPVVILTASNQLDDINRAYEKNANSYLIKPPRFEDMKELIRKIGEYWLTANARPQIGSSTIESYSRLPKSSLPQMDSHLGDTAVD